MNWVYRLNWWYDDQPEPRRFLMFIVPWALLIVMVMQDFYMGLRLIGALLMCGIAGIRILPFATRRERPKSVEPPREP